MSDSTQGKERGGGREIYPVLPLRDIVAFPYMIVPLFVGREKSINALEEVMRSDKQILLSAQKNAGDDDPAGAAAGPTVSAPISADRLSSARWPRSQLASRIAVISASGNAARTACTAGCFTTAAAAFSVSAFAIVQRIKSAVALSAGIACQSFSALARASMRSITSSCSGSGVRSVMA